MTQSLIGYWIRRHAPAQNWEKKIDKWGKGVVVMDFSDDVVLGLQASESRVKELDIVTAEKYGSEFDDMLHKRLEKEIEELI